MQYLRLQISLGWQFMMQRENMRSPDFFSEIGKNIFWTFRLILFLVPDVLNLFPMSKIDLNRHGMKCTAYGMWLYDKNATNASKMCQRTGNKCPGERTLFRWFEQCNKGDFQSKISLEEGDLLN